MSIEFVPSSWYQVDEKGKCVIYMFGRTDKNESITVKVLNFMPSFAIRIPETWSDKDYLKAGKYLIDLYCTNKRRWEERNKNDVKICLVEYLEDIYENFCAHKKFPFMRFKFASYQALKNFYKLFNNSIIIPGLYNGKEKFHTYGKKLDPILNFIIDQNLNSGSWNIVKEYEELDVSKVTTKIYISTNYKNIVPYQGEEKPLPQFVIASYDIECSSGDGSFPKPSNINDEVISLCITTNNYGSEAITGRYALGLKSSSKIKDVDMQTFNDEQDLLLAHRDLIQDIDPDFIIGFNTTNFDNEYVNVKANQLWVNCAKEYSKISRLRDHECPFKLVPISSSALGDNNIKLYEIPGREQLDIMRLVQQDFSLQRYTLDHVAESLLQNKIKNIVETDEHYIITTNSKDVNVSNYIKFEIYSFIEKEKYYVERVEDVGSDRILHVKKQYVVDEEEKVVRENEDTEEVENEMESDIEGNQNKKEQLDFNQYAGSILDAKKYCLAKDDFSIEKMNQCYRATHKERKFIHKYCLQDCILLNKLCHRLDFITMKMELANVASVPLNYIILRGQGIKTLALFTKYCKSRNCIIRDIAKKEDEIDKYGNVIVSTYDGALVLDPLKGFYDQPITTLDFNSLYPSCEMSYDMSHENLVINPEYENLPDYHYRYHTYERTVGTEKIPTTVCFATHISNIDEKGNQIDGKYGIVGSILDNLLKKRKIAKKNAEKYPQKYQIYDNQQKALKVTANSIYGQMGAPTSPVALKEIAAATTAVGRKLLMLAKNHSEEKFKPICVKLYKAWKKNDESKVNEILDENLADRNNEKFITFIKETLYELFSEHDIEPIVIYGDTDSNFIKFGIYNKNTFEPRKDRWARVMCIKLGQIESAFLRIHLPYPNNMAYEKVIHPMALINRKMYIGQKYEDNPDSCVKLIMGFKLKRRDTSPIFQKTVGRAVDMALVPESNPLDSVNFLFDSMKNIIDGKYSIHNFLTSKLLKSKYKGEKLTSDSTGKKGEKGEWFWDDVNTSACHVMLAQRMKARDPGSAPHINTRLPFVYIVKHKEKDTKVGEMIEHPDYIAKHNVKIDYMYYITNQIKNPSVQFFELLCPDIEERFETLISEEMKKKKEYLYQSAKKEAIKTFKNLGMIDNKDKNAVDEDVFFTSTKKIVKKK